MQSRKESLAKNCRKNVGQLGWVKLLPMVESNGTGNEISPVGSAVASASDEVEVASEAVVVGTTVLAWLVCCLACSRIGGLGGSLRSNRRPDIAMASPDNMLLPRTG